MTSSWFFLSTLNYDARSTTHRQLLMMGTWLPETCWVTIRREIKNTKVTSSWFFLSTLKHRCLERGNKLNYFIQFLISCSKFHTKRQAAVGCKNSDPKRSVAEYCIVNRDMVTGNKNIEFSLSIATQCLPLGKFAVLMIAVRTENICRFFIIKEH